MPDWAATWRSWARAPPTEIAAILRNASGTVADVQLPYSPAARRNVARGVVPAPGNRVGSASRSSSGTVPGSSPSAGGCWAGSAGR